MQGNENKNMKTRIQTKRANKHNRLSCLISTSISFHSMCLVIIKICGYVVYCYVVKQLLQVCIVKLNQQTNQQKPHSIWFYWLVNE